MNIKFNEKTHVYIDVPYDDKDEVKATKKAWYDVDNKKWFVLKTNQELIERFPIRERKYIELSYDDRHKARDLDAHWDADRKSWYIYE